MRYLLCPPHRLRRALAENLPLVVALGVQEYHGGHLPLGVNLLTVTRCLDLLEAAAPDSFALHLQTQAFHPLAEALFSALLRAGFRNIHGVIHHQTEHFAQGMPTDLTFRLAARNAVFAHLEATRGPGWWGAQGMEAYCADHALGANPFNWVQIHPLMTPEVAQHLPFDHAGEGETALMLAPKPSRPRAWPITAPGSPPRPRGPRPHRGRRGSRSSCRI